MRNQQDADTTRRSNTTRIRLAPIELSSDIVVDLYGKTDARLGTAPFIQRRCIKL
ncbi:MAG: hypothetical protein JSW50_13800 [Candidatus Latescibacterota bacterium]|nr:MAG: hypothetical protein JSW50_13800 [Candidatus Latescibacterota bacterium]